jgi:ubiquinone/menaquinone biosynthesis C-methylase UbiE
VGPASGLFRLKPVLKRALPAPVWELLRQAAGRSPAPPAAPPPASIYEALYEEHGKQHSDEDVVGAGSFDLIGRIELGLLLQEGLEPRQTLLDFGCGTGRLAVHVIPRLAAGGHYIGVDVSQSMLDKAQVRLAAILPPPACRISWVKQTTPVFPFPDRSIDLICAFSVFTHLEHEDSYLYLKDALRVIRPGGRFIFSCLPMDTPLARDVFLASTRDDFQARWGKVRNVTTSRDLMEEIARFAGWAPVHWYHGEEQNIELPDGAGLAALGQSSCILEAPGGPTSGVAARAAAPRATTVGADLDPREVGRIELSWEEGAPSPAPHFTGPLEGTADRFHLFPSDDPRARGALDAPPFAELSHQPERRRSAMSVSRLVSGGYRFSVAGAGDLRSTGVTVRVRYRESAMPMVFRLPRGAGSRWTVFDVSVERGAVHLKLVNTIEEMVDLASSAWSPLPSGAPDPTLDPDQRCPVCRNDHVRAPGLAPRPHSPETRAHTVMRKHVYEYRRCGSCGLLFAVPRPSASELLRRLAYWAEVGPRLSPAEQEAALRAVESRFDWIRRHHPRARTLLDVGAGAGAFVAAARRAGLDARGVELVPESARFPGIELLVGDLERLGLPARSYDVVTLWDTIEHLVDPLATIQAALALIKDDGILVVETPNERGVSARLRGSEWWVFGPTDHLVMFSPATLGGLVRRAGGRIVHLHTRELCSWNDPGSSRPLPPRGRLLEYARATRGTRHVLRALGLGDWVFAIGRPDRPGATAAGSG